MKHKLLKIVFFTSIFSLASCGFPYHTKDKNSHDPVDVDVDIDIDIDDDIFVDPNNNPISKPSSGSTTINIVAFNDFHGAVEKKDSQIGLENFATYIYSKARTENTLILDQGDTWQGSIYSNYNYGKLLNDVFSYAHVHARTVGNHDFDWGVDVLKTNTARSFANYKIPVLAANVYDYDFTTKTVGNIHQDDIGVKSVSYTLKNGIKVGIVGVIGQDQITSILSSYTENICFTNHIPVIKSEATNLRNSGCDIVIASIHGGQGDVLNNNLSNYVDLVLCGHTHKYESSSEGLTNYYQFGNNGEMIGDITLNFDYATNKVTSTTYNVVSSSTLNVKTPNKNITKIISEYNKVCDTAANEVLANNVSGSFAKKGEAANLMCKAIYDEAVKENQSDVIMAMANYGREDLPSYTWTYANLYECFPFDNCVYIVEVEGKDIVKELNYNYAYFNPSFDKVIQKTSRYKIAVIDYLLYHINSSRYYDYFPSFDGYITKLSKNYRVILKDWLKENNYHNSVLLSASDYSSSLPSFDTGSVSSY